MAPSANSAALSPDITFAEAPEKPFCNTKIGAGKRLIISRTNSALDKIGKPGARQIAPGRARSTSSKAARPLVALPTSENLA